MLDALTMRHYVQRCGNLIHVTNQIGPYTGQHHVHTEAKFKRWARDKDPSTIDTETLRRCEPCDCGLTAGQVKP